MSILQALLISLWAGFCSYDDQGSQLLRRPLLIGPMVGIIMGDIPTGLVISGTLELVWMGLGNMAGYKTPDMIIGTIVGVSVAISTGAGTSSQAIAAGIAAATTVAILSQQLLLVFDFIRQMFAPWADRIALTGDFDGLLKINIISITLQFLIRAIPTFLVVYLQDGIVKSILNAIPGDILKGLGVAAGILPAIGLSILMTMMMKGFMWPFLILGFTLAAYLQLGILPITLISLAFAMIYSFIMEVKDNQSKVPVVSNKISDDGGYDL